MAASSCQVRKSNWVNRLRLCRSQNEHSPFSSGIFSITWAPFSRSLRALTADKKPPTPLVEDTIGSAMGGAVEADGVVD